MCSGRCSIRASFCSIIDDVTHGQIVMHCWIEARSASKGAQAVTLLAPRASSLFICIDCCIRRCMRRLQCTVARRR